MSSSQKPCHHFLASSVEGVVVTAQSSKSQELTVGHVLKGVSRMAREKVEIGMSVCWFAVEVSVEKSVLERNVNVQEGDRFRRNSVSELNRVVKSVDVVKEGVQVVRGPCPEHEDVVYEPSPEFLCHWDRAGFEKRCF